MFGLSTKLAQKDARIKELEAQLAALPPVVATTPGVVPEAAAPETIVPAPTEAAAKKDGDGDAEESKGKGKSSDDNDGDALDEDDDTDDSEDEDLEEEDKKKAAGLAPLEAAQFRAACLRTKLHAARAKEATFEQRVTAEVTTRDTERQKGFEDKVGLRAAQIFASATGAPLKANPSNAADGGASKADNAALKGRAATVAAIKAEREAGLGRTA